MAPRGPRHDVELVEDDEPGGASPVGQAAPVGEAPAAPARRRRRRPLVVGTVLATVLVAGAAVGQVVVDRREQARIAGVAEQPGAVELLTGPPAARWDGTVADVFGSVDVHTPDGLLVGVQHVGQGPVRVAAHDAATGAEVWQVELIDGAAPPDGDVPGGSFSRSGSCAVPPGQEQRVTCLVHDAGRRVGTEDVHPSVVRVVTLDTRDGSVVDELTDALALDTAPSSFVVTRDVVVVGTDTDTETSIRAVGWDGSPAWDATFPVPALTDEVFSAYVTQLGDLVAVVSPTELQLRDATGRTVRTEALRDEYVTGWGDQLLTVPVGQITTDETDLTTTVVRAGGTVVVAGEPVVAGVDDGSVPGLVLTTLDRSLVAWDADGARLWTSDLAVPDAVLLLDGRVHLDDGLQLLTLDARTGRELWRSEVARSLPMTDGRHLLALAAAPGRGQGSELVALDPGDGSERWRSPLPDGTEEVLSILHLLIAVDYGDGQTEDRFTVLR